MFSRSSKPTPPGAANNPSKNQAKDKPAAPSVISSDMRIVGDLNSKGETQIDGIVEGDINSHVLLVGESAKITGEIMADTVRIHGSVNGEIKARSVILASTSNVVGNILHENITIEKGAHLEGHLTRMAEKEVKATMETRINLVGGGSQAGSPQPSGVMPTATAKS